MIIQYLSALLHHYSTYSLHVEALENTETTQFPIHLVWLGSSVIRPLPTTAGDPGWILILGCTINLRVLANPCSPSTLKFRVLKDSQMNWGSLID